MFLIKPYWHLAYSVGTPMINDIPIEKFRHGVVDIGTWRMRVLWKLAAKNFINHRIAGLPIAIASLWSNFDESSDCYNLDDLRVQKTQLPRMLLKVDLEPIYFIRLFNQHIYTLQFPVLFRVSSTKG
jgi:hypothetical protein